MRKACIVLIIAFYFFSGKGFAQHIGKKDAIALMEKTLVFLKVSDENGFVSLWSTQTSSLSNQAPLTLQELQEHYKEMKIFLDTAITQGSQPGEVTCIRLSKLEQNEFGANSKVTVYYSFSQGNRKGISFYTVKEKGVWKFRAAPEYLIDKTDSKP